MDHLMRIGFIKTILKNKTDILENEVKIIVFGEPEVQIDKTNKKISIKRIKEDDRVVLNGGILRNWEIQMRDFTDFRKLKVIGFDKNNLTGCLNFYDINLIDVKLNFENSNCEDAINFVRAKGSVREMNIQNSSFDAMDADFSKLQFNNLKINKSLNDCLDFSFGEYEIYNSEISNCADKGISVGELSKVKINKVSIKNSESGVVSKDFASVHISESRIFKTEYCFKAYNKKPEFSGGLINSKNNNCIFNHEFALVDLSSKLILNNKDYSETEWKNKKGKGEYNGI